jgi:peptidoglycan/LPS O-acetylase OafA/YrhL
MDRSTLLLLLAFVFASALAFAAIRYTTEGQDPNVTLSLQMTAWVLLIGVLVAILRRRR